MTAATTQIKTGVNKLSIVGDSAELTFQTVSLPSGTISIILQNPDGVRSIPASLVVRPAKAPVLSFFYARRGAPGAVRTFSGVGSGFLPGLVLSLTSPSNKVISTLPPIFDGTSFQVDLIVTDEPGTWTIRATNPDGQSSVFTSLIPSYRQPTITGVSPSVFRVDEPTTVTVTGTDFIPANSGFGPTQFRITEQATGFGDSTSAATILSPTSARITMAVSRTGKWNLIPYTPDGVAGPGVPVDAGPGRPKGIGVPATRIVAQATPQPVIVNAQRLQNGFTLQLTPRSGPTVLIPASAITPVVAGASYSAQLPLPTAGDWSMKVTNPDGQQSLDSATFIVIPPNPPVPIITRGGTIDNRPTSPALADTVVGSGFQPGANAVITMADGTHPLFMQSTTLSSDRVLVTFFSVPTAATVQVTNPDGQSSAVVPITVIMAPPRLSTPINLWVRADTAQAITLRGAQFQSGVRLTVTAPTGVATSYAADESSLKQGILTLPLTLASAGEWAVVATNPDGQQSAPITLHVAAFPAMTLTSVTPAGISASPDARAVTITGSGFQPDMFVSLRHGLSDGTSVSYTFSGNQLLSLTSTSLTLNAVLSDKGVWVVQVGSSSTAGSAAMSITLP